MPRLTQATAEPRPVKPIAELLAAAGGRAPTTCPGCGREHACYATSSYQTLRFGRRRLRKCRFCEYAHTETVPAPVIEGEVTAVRE